MKSLVLSGVILSTMVSAAIANPPPWDANTVNLEIEKLSEGVYAVYDDRAQELAVKGVPLSTSAGIIVGDDGVLLIDTMMNKRLYEQLIDLVESVTDKPIKYAVNTSFHGDHSYANYLLSADVEIIQHVNTSQFVKNNFEHDTQWMISNFGEGRGIEQAVAKTGDILINTNESIVLDLGDKQVLIKDFGFAQTGGDLMVYAQDAKVLWTGNPIVAGKPGLPWLLDGKLVSTLNTLNAVYDFLPSDAVVVPGHSLPSDKSAIKWNIDYLTEVKTQVQDAIDNKLSLEQTQAKVTMNEYRGYALFDWVHPALNVPAAYQELSE
ncbi:MAG: MBL fold metallo-hydrolase [Saccharospirillaceae bacterium]|nr:MBL fold metallo-hydrolase [Saccharospirillaceae bacterium]